jgi:hypothetical protein
MDPSFIPIETVPSKTPFGLDQLRRSYKTALSAEDAIAAAPAVGTVDEVFPCMFLMPITTPESAESATRVDLVYMGTIAFTGTGVDGDPFLPVLPAQKRDADNAVQSASSSRASDGRTANPPLTLQFYAPTSTLSYFSFGAPGSSVASDPTDPLQPITITLGDQALSVGSGTIEALIAAFFGVQILETHQSTEIVPGQYWQNSSKKVKSYTALIASITPGPYVVLEAPGTSYHVGDILTIAGGGGTAVITLTNVGISNSIVNWTITSITCTTEAHGLGATGGGGSGALFGVIIVT